MAQASAPTTDSNGSVGSAWEARCVGIGAAEQSAVTVEEARCAFTIGSGTSVPTAAGEGYARTGGKCDTAHSVLRW